MFNGHTVSAWEEETVLEMDGGDGYTVMWMYLMPLNCTLKNGYDVNFMICIFDYNF